MNSMVNLGTLLPILAIVVFVIGAALVGAISWLALRARS